MSILFLLLVLMTPTLCGYKISKNLIKEKFYKKDIIDYINFSFIVNLIAMVSLILIYRTEGIMVDLFYYDFNFSVKYMLLIFILGIGMGILRSILKKHLEIKLEVKNAKKK